MRCVSALALVLLALPACAQRGAAHGGLTAPAGGGFRGGLSGPSFHSSFSAPRSPAFSSATRLNSPARYASRRPSTPLRSAYSGYGRPSTARPLFYTRGQAYPPDHQRYGYGYQRNRYGNRYGGLYPHGYPYLYPSYVNWGFLNPFWDYSDAFDFDDPYGAATDTATAPYADPPQTPAQDAPQYPAQDPPQYPSQGQAQPQTYPVPDNPISEPQFSPYSPPAASAPAQDEDPITVVFKDQRPSLQVHNYALTRTSLFIFGRRVREIPLTEINLAATQQINRAAGVDFQIPR